MPSGSFKDRNALSFQDEVEQDNARSASFIDKKKRKSKGLEIMFDQDQHREYVTGFHKRKVERRNKAKIQKAEKERKQRLENKAEKRAKMREELDIEKYETPSESEGDAKPGLPVGKGVKVYSTADATTTVTIAPLVLDSDEERLAQEEGTSCSDGEQTGNQIKTGLVEAQIKLAGAVRKQPKNTLSKGRKAGSHKAKKRKKGK